MPLEARVVGDGRVRLPRLLAVCEGRAAAAATAVHEAVPVRLQGQAEGLAQPEPEVEAEAGPEARAEHVRKEGRPVAALAQRVPGVSHATERAEGERPADVRVFAGAAKAVEEHAAALALLLLQPIHDSVLRGTPRGLLGRLAGLAGLRRLRLRRGLAHGLAAAGLADTPFGANQLLRLRLRLRHRAGGGRFPPAPGAAVCAIPRQRRPRRGPLRGRGRGGPR
mmetsp:Transcript_25463/g.73492  ORF Transcript_25463/g.73492 Transcript_25463/m.73492 type:complete len:223 (-) Transcript_25463:621-1289(-)